MRVNGLVWRAIAPTPSFRNGHPGVEINKIFRLVGDEVMEATAARPAPYTYGSLPGRDDYF
jgi:hypothetical protein